MLRFIKQKIVNQLWLSLCLMLGLSLLVATFSCRPMFIRGSLDRLLSQMFVQHISDENEYPTVIGEKGIVFSDEITSISDITTKLQTNFDERYSKINDISTVTSQTKIWVDNIGATRELSDKNTNFNVSYMPNMLDHATITKGEDYNASAEEGYIPCIVSERVMDIRDLSIGETIICPENKNEQGDKLQFVIVGIFTEKESVDLFWYTTPNHGMNDLYVSEENLDLIAFHYQAARMGYQQATLLNYHDVTNRNVDNLIRNVRAFADKSEDFFYNFEEELTTFERERDMIDITLWVMQLPILGMVFAFIYMLSNQIVESEKAEIATLKSRGVNRFQVIVLYAVRLGILALISTLIGIPMGYGFCKMAASTTDFLTFSMGNTKTYQFTLQMLPYGLAAAAIGVVFILLPVIKHSKISIVECKSNYQQGKRVFYEKYFLDVLLLALSLYLLYSSNKSIDALRDNALAANSLDPVVFLNSCLFIVAAGMVTFRLMHYLVILIYSIRKKKWKSVSYVAFLQITRTFRKQTFISIFMILTVAMGLFNANAARTINRNNEDRIRYGMGAEVRIQEKWKAHQYAPDAYRYIEPDYVKYQNLVSEGLCDNVTKVMVYQNAKAEVKRQYASNCLVMGIDTKAFGETARLKDELNGEKHWYNSLNTLAVKTSGVIISRNFAEQYRVKIGDRISIHSLAQNSSSSSSNTMGVNIVDIVDAWPGYEQYYYEDGKLCERYLLVVNQTSLLQSFEIRPYEIWAKLAPGVTAEELKDYLEEKEVTLVSFESASSKIDVMKNSPKIQITNGMFTLSFMIAMGLCAVGFLIYWISSIRQRELLFGVYRAMGMSVPSLNRMLIYEHVFSTLLSVLAGGLVGVATTLLFIKLFGVVYLPEKSNLDIYTYYETGDMIKLFSIIAIVIVVCLFILRRLIKKMNITQALKLGED